MALDGRDFLTVAQQTISQRLASCLRASIDRRATNAVIWSTKSMRTANAAYRANDLTAGIVLRAPGKREREIKEKVTVTYRAADRERISRDNGSYRWSDSDVQLRAKFLRMIGNLPKKKQTDSDKLQSSMLGATFPRTRPICSSRFSSGRRESL